MSRKSLILVLSMAIIVGLSYSSCTKDPAGKGSAPSVPSLMSPADGTTDLPTSPILRWHSSSGATNYVLQVSTNISFSSFALNKGGITSTTFTVSDLADSTQYYWRVSASNSHGSSGWSSVWTFTTGAAAVPVPPTLSFPPDGATDVDVNLTLSWNTSPGANNYNLQVSTGSSFSTLIVNRPGITSTNYTVEKLARSTAYYWRVNAVNSYGASDWSSVWTFTTAGVSGSWVVYDTLNSGLPGNYVTAIAIDAEGNKWFGTDHWGTSKFNDTSWTTYDWDSGLASNSVNCINIDAQGKIWFGTYNGASKFDGANWTTYNTSNSGLVADLVFSIAFGREGDVWLGTSDGASRYDGADWTNYNTSNSGLPHNLIQAVALDDQGNVWFGTYNGASKFDGTNWIIYNTSNSGLPDNSVWAMELDDRGNVWFGTHNGVCKFDGANWSTYNTSNSGLPGNEVLAIASDAEGNVWFGVLGGASKFDGTNWTTYTISNSGLPDDQVMAIAVDAERNKWFGTIEGAARFHE